MDVPLAALHTLAHQTAALDQGFQTARQESWGMGSATRSVSLLRVHSTWATVGFFQSACGPQRPTPWGGAWVGQARAQVRTN